MHQILLVPGFRHGPRWGSSRRSTKPCIRLGTPLPILHPFDAYGASFSVPTAPHLELRGGETCFRDLGDRHPCA